MAVALDMLNELKRCPKELFDTLDFSHQSRFCTISSDHNEVRQVRNTDRFAHLALSYIDSNRLFKRIRFHVNMGKLRYLFASEKHCIDGQTRMRILEHPLNGYGRLEEIEEARKSKDGTFGNTNIPIRTFEQTLPDKTVTQSFPYVVDTYSHYILQYDKVEMCFYEESRFPKISNKDSKWYVENEIPACRMSTLELPAMIFHMHLLGHQKTEMRIKEVHDKYMALFRALAEGKLTLKNIEDFGIPRCDIPKKVLDAVNNETDGKDFDSYVRKEVEAMLEDTAKRIERMKSDRRTVNSRENKMGKPGFKRIMSGKLAEFIAKDIVRFQPSLRNGYLYGTDRLTGQNYSVMQTAIATYNDYEDAFEQLKQIFTAAHLIGGDRKRNHPFLYLALRQKRPSNTVDFYMNYLKARQVHLRDLMSNLEQGKSVIPTFINKKSSKWAVRNQSYYQELGEIYADELAIELPRQMFDDDIKDTLKKMPEMRGVDFECANVTYLISEYFRRVYNDDVQNFYSYPRTYRYIDFLICETDGKNSPVKQYTETSKREQLWEARIEKTEIYKKWALHQKINNRNDRTKTDKEFAEILEKRLSICRNEFQKNEKTIRRFKVQDILLFLLANKTLNEHLDFKAKNFKLQDISPEAERGIMSEIMPIDFTFDKNGQKYTIHSDGMKLKKYGEFFAIANDKRFTSLLNIISAIRVNKEDIEKELDNYDTCRPNVVKLILEFEKGAFEKFPEMRNLITDKKHFDFSGILRNCLKIIQ